MHVPAARFVKPRMAAEPYPAPFSIRPPNPGLEIPRSPGQRRLVPFSNLVPILRKDMAEKCLEIPLGFVRRVAKNLRMTQRAGGNLSLQVSLPLTQVRHFKRDVEPRLVSSQ